MGLILLSYTIEVVFCKCGRHCNFTIKKGGEKLLVTPEQPADLKFCMEALDAVAVLRGIPADEHGGLMIMLETAFRQHEEEMRRKPVGATPVQMLMFEAIEPVAQTLVDIRTAARRK